MSKNTRQKISEVIIEPPPGVVEKERAAKRNSDLTQSNANIKLLMVRELYSETGLNSESISRILHLSKEYVDKIITEETCED
jgi:hypothetical protein